MEKYQEELMEGIASFLNYKVQNNIIIECGNEEKEEIKKFLLGLQKDVDKYNGKIIVINKKISKRSREKLIEENKEKNIILVLDNDFFPSKPRDMDSLFYYLSRLPLEVKETNIILVKSVGDFYLELSDATMSSLLPKSIKFTAGKGVF